MRRRCSHADGASEASSGSGALDPAPWRECAQEIFGEGCSLEIKSEAPLVMKLIIAQLTIGLKSAIRWFSPERRSLDGNKHYQCIHSTTAPAGTIIGALTAYDASGAALVSQFELTKNSAGVFGVSGNNLVTERASIAVGNYSVRVHAVATNARFSGSANFLIAVTP